MRSATRFLETRRRAFDEPNHDAVAALWRDKAGATDPRDLEPLEPRQRKAAERPARARQAVRQMAWAQPKRLIKCLRRRQDQIAAAGRKDRRLTASFRGDTGHRRQVRKDRAAVLCNPPDFGQG